MNSSAAATACKRWQQIWDSLLTQMPEQVMTQDEVVRLLIALHERGLIECDVAPDVESIFRARDAKRRRDRLASANPLAFRLSLFDPSTLLGALRPTGRLLFSSAAFLPWLAMVAVAGTAAAMHWGELVAHATLVTGSPHYLFMTWLMYPFIKAVHELAHGLAVQRWGGPVKRAGVSLLMLTPLPFVNASAADGFRHRHQRAIVSAAGIMAELAIAALAMGVWVAVQPGGVRDAALLAMLIGAVSTLLVNGNPLMRFDGYYLFTDLLDLRNLAPRSTRFWAQTASRFVLGARNADPLEALPGERPWLIAYVPLATAYRISLSIGVGLWIGNHSALLGAVVGTLIFLSSVGKPLWSAARAVAAAGTGAAIWRAGALATALLALLALVPVPFTTMAQGVVWVPERAQIRAQTDGFVAKFEVADGQAVQAGDLLLTLKDERLQAAQAQLAADAVDIEVEMFTAMQADPDKVPALRQKLAYSRAEIARNDEKIAQLQVRADASGIAVIEHQADQLGVFHKRGDLLGYLMTGDPVTVRVALPQDEAGLVRKRANGVGVRLSEDGWRLRNGEVRAATGMSVVDQSGAVAKLPSAALGELGGGDIATDPSDKEGLTARAPVVLMDVVVADARSERIGARAMVRFDHGHASIGEQALRKLQQLVLQHFNPAG